MVRDTVQRVMFALAIPCLVLAVVRGGLSVAFGWDAPEAGWFGTVAGLLLVAEMVYGWLRKRDDGRLPGVVDMTDATIHGSSADELAKQVSWEVRGARKGML